MRRSALALLLAAAPAAAQDRPQLIPTRDVSVTYRITHPNIPAGGPQTLTMSWLAASGLLRTDIPGLGYAIADQRAGSGFMVMEAARMIVDIPASQAMQIGAIPANATFRREGTATVAGLSCITWSYQDQQTQGRSCITSEGVLLRGEGTHGGQSGSMEATAVTFAPQDRARFHRPQGYQAMPGPPGAAPARPQAK